MRKTMIWSATLLAGLATAMAAMSAMAQDVKQVTIPAGTRILIRTIESIDSSEQAAGYRFSASLETNLQVEDVVVAPRGTPVLGRLASASSAGRMTGSSELTLELTDIVIGGTAYPLLTNTYEIKGKGEGSNTAKKNHWWRRTGRAHRRAGRRRQGSWDRCARRCRRRHSPRRFQEGRATFDSERVSTGVQARRTGDITSEEPGLTSRQFARLSTGRFFSARPSYTQSGVDLC